MTNGNRIGCDPHALDAVRELTASYKAEELIHHEGHEGTEKKFNHKGHKDHKVEDSDSEN